jgi:hypothetical protein
MRATLIRSILAALCLAAALTGCSAGPLGESLPESLGGLPAGTPPPPKVPYQFPPVHERPPPRATQPLTDEQQWKLEQDLNALRNRQEKREAADKAGAAAKSATKATKATKAAKAKKARKKPMALHGGESTGAQSRP